ncbi:hypothetical protein [Arthrobacter sp. M4]|nr:hypothetical protein [Arthrobacter sp. M4]MCA4133043.1 hypothetical protein [Arthrobacter sp. M4]
MGTKSNYLDRMHKRGLRERRLRMLSYVLVSLLAVAALAVTIYSLLT